MSYPIGEHWIKSVVLIENEKYDKGTGFIVFREVEEEDEGSICVSRKDTQEKSLGKFFLVTNKHVLHKDYDKRLSASSITLNLNFRDDRGSIVGGHIRYQWNLEEQDKAWREHPDKNVDVLAFNISTLIQDYPNIAIGAIEYHLFATKEILDNYDVTAGNEIITLGYPNGLRQGSTNFPLLRSGIVASHIGDILIDEYQEFGELRQRKSRGFLIDGAVIPGSSGSPVILNPASARSFRNERGSGVMIAALPPLLLGIVAETRYAPVKTPAGDRPSFAGLGLAFDAVTIQETIELFFQN